MMQKVMLLLIETLEDNSTSPEKLQNSLEGYIDRVYWEFASKGCNEV